MPAPALSGPEEEWKALTQGEGAVVALQLAQWEANAGMCVVREDE